MAERPASSEVPLPGMPPAPVRFDPEQKRAFGSVPTLLGKEIDIPPLHRLNQWALEHTEPAMLRRGLYGREGNNAVNGLVLNTTQFEVIVRSHPAFESAIRNKTLAANTATNDLRTREKELKSVLGSWESKQARHAGILTGLGRERDNLTTLAEWQRVPGYWRTREADLRIMTTQAWEMSFANILQVLREQHELSPEQHVDMTHALAHKLVRGPQAERMKHWGGMLGLAIDYNRDVTLLFEHSARQIELSRDRLGHKLGDFYSRHGLLPQ